MVKETWRFSSFSHIRGSTVVRAWRWIVESPTRTATSNTFFKSLETCMRDAKLHGFDAPIDPQRDALTQNGYTFKFFEDGTVAFTPEV